MKKLILILSYSFILNIICVAQNLSFKVEAETMLLGINAYAVVRLDETVVNLNAIDELEIKERYAITILNESGLEHAFKYVYYDKNKKVYKFNAILYDANGNETKKYKKKDVVDRSAVSSFSLFEDDRVMFYNIVPNSYPFTIYYELETKTKNTFWLPRWFPIPDFLVGGRKLQI